MSIREFIKALNTDPSLENEEDAKKNLLSLKKKQAFYSEAFQAKFDSNEVYTKSQLIRVVIKTARTRSLLSDENPYLVVVEPKEDDNMWLSLEYYDPSVEEAGKKIRKVESKEQEDKAKNWAELVNAILNIVANFESKSPIDDELVGKLVQTFNDTQQLSITRTFYVPSFSDVLLNDVIDEFNEFMPLNRMINFYEESKPGEDKLGFLIYIDFLLREFRERFETSENPLAFCYRADGNRESVFLVQKEALDSEFETPEELSVDAVPQPPDTLKNFLSMVSFLYQEALKNTGGAKEKIAFCLDLFMPV